MTNRLVKTRFDDKMKVVGRRIIRITIGSPIIVGAANEANKFSFI